MSDFAKNGVFPSINVSSLNDVTSEERSSAIDFVNRNYRTEWMSWNSLTFLSDSNNFVFEEFNVEKVLSTFLPDGAVYHIGGAVRGRADMKIFLEDYAKVYIRGISRNAMNHVVDRDDDGVMVRYHQHLVRYAWPKDTESVTVGGDLLSDDGLPSTWFFATVIDRLRKTPEGWKVFERHLGPAFRDNRLENSNAP